MNRLTPETCPVGTRLLASRVAWSPYGVDEYEVVEWSPGGMVKLRCENGAKLWNTPPFLVEVLPTQREGRWEGSE